MGYTLFMVVEETEVYRDRSILSETERVELGFRFGSIASSTATPDSMVILLTGSPS
jgi:hypothetical protein